MNEAEIIQILKEIANLLEIRGENPFKIRAYQKAVRAIDGLSQPLEHLHTLDLLQSIDGIGKAIADKIAEAFETGRMTYYEELKASLPDGLSDLLRVAGLGPKKVKLIYETQGIASIPELKQAAEQGQLRSIAGMGKKTEAKILKSILNLEGSAGHFHLGIAAPIALEILNRLTNVEGVEKAEIAGSLRRGQETVRRLILVVSAQDGEAVVDEFLATEGIQEALSRSGDCVSIVLKRGLPIDLHLVPMERFGAALRHYTGSEAHNAQLQKYAQKEKLEIVEHGLFETGSKTPLACTTEEAIFQKLGLSWIAPELREGLDEIELARQNDMPPLLERADIRAAFHNHTVWSDGRMTLEELALEAERRGFEYIAVTDHSGSLGIANGLKPERLERQIEAIHQFNESQNGIRVLCGSEVDIHADGTLDFPDSLLERLDVVIAAVHIALDQPRDRMTQRVCRALENPHVDILAHPTARLLGRRPPVELDMEKVFSTAAETGTALEINAHFLRLDLNDKHIREAKHGGITFTLDTDTHGIRDFDNLGYGLKTARRGRLGPDDVLNTMGLEDFLERRG